MYCSKSFNSANKPVTTLVCKVLPTNNDILLLFIERPQNDTVIKTFDPIIKTCGSTNETYVPTIKTCRPLMVASRSCDLYVHTDITFSNV